MLPFLESKVKNICLQKSALDVIQNKKTICIY